MAYVKIALVGGCGSGKTTIAAELKRAGHDAYIVGQEHSEVRTLWAVRSPEAVVYLHVTLDVVRERRGEHWPGWLYKKQQQRLKNAYEAADVHVNTAEQTVEESVEAILAMFPGDGDHESSAD